MRRRTTVTALPLAARAQSFPNGSIRYKIELDT
jgi:hypothetical protein